jgi:hypothetical protein
MSIFNWFSFLSSCILSVVCYTLCCSLSLVCFLFPFSLAFSLLTFFASFYRISFILFLFQALLSLHFFLSSCIFFSFLLSRVCVTSSFPFVSFIFRVVSWLLILSLASHLVSALLSLLSNLRYLIARLSYLIFGYLSLISCFLSFVFWFLSSRPLLSPILSVVSVSLIFFMFFPLVSFSFILSSLPLSFVSCFLSCPHGLLYCFPYL